MKTPTVAQILDVYDRLCELISRKRKIAADHIYQDDSLTADIGFTKRGLRAFARNINSVFKTKLSATKVASCKTVGALCDCIVEVLP